MNKSFLNKSSFALRLRRKRGLSHRVRGAARRKSWRRRARRRRRRTVRVPAESRRTRRWTRWSTRRWRSRSQAERNVRAVKREGRGVGGARALIGRIRSLKNGREGEDRQSFVNTEK